jgi:hypothetical protein
LVTESLVDPLPAGLFSYDSATRTLSYNAGNLDRRIILFYSTRVIDRTTYLNSNGSFSFRNDAELSWNNEELTDFPKDTANAAVGSGGLISKTVGGTENYIDPDKRIISWTITVNRNAIVMPEGTEVSDTIPPDQKVPAGYFSGQRRRGEYRIIGAGWIHR